MTEGGLTTDELIALARKRFAAGFPNPQRAGCPEPGAIQTAVQAERLPAENLQAHLFACSACFNEYRAVLIEHRQLTASKTSAGWWRGLLAAPWTWQRSLMAIGCAALLLAAIVFTWQRRLPAPQLSESRPQPVPASPASSVLPTDRAAPESGGRIPRPSDERLLAVSTDLNDHRPLGAQQRNGGGNQTELPIRLPRARFRLALQLRELSAPGIYRVSVLDLSGRRHATARARSHDGQRLQVTLDLRGFPEAKASLRIERPDQPDLAPENYQVHIARP